MKMTSAEIQEAFDGRNYYIPSFFRIKLEPARTGRVPVSRIIGVSNNQ